MLLTYVVSKTKINQATKICAIYEKVLDILDGEIIETISEDPEHFQFDINN